MSEQQFLAWMAGHRTPVLDAVMLALTALGRGGAIWVVGAIARASGRPRLWMATWQVFLAVTLAWVAPDAVFKPLLHRPRPFVVSPSLEVLGGRPVDFSMPSGHASSAVAGAYALSAMWPAGRVAWWSLAALVAFSRLYLGVHYPTDLLVGALLGWFIGWFVVGRSAWSAARPATASAGGARPGPEPADTRSR